MPAAAPPSSSAIFHIFNQLATEDIDGQPRHLPDALLSITRRPLCLSYAPPQTSPLVYSTSQELISKKITRRITPIQCPPVSSARSPSSLTSRRMMWRRKRFPMTSHCRAVATSTGTSSPSTHGAFPKGHTNTPQGMPHLQSIRNPLIPNLSLLHHHPRPPFILLFIQHPTHLNNLHKRGRH